MNGLLPVVIFLIGSPYLLAVLTWRNLRGLEHDYMLHVHTCLPRRGAHGLYWECPQTTCGAERRRVDTPAPKHTL